MLKTFLAGLAVLAFLMAINVLAGLLMLGIWRGAAWLHPALLEHTIVVVPLGLIAIGLAIWAAFIAWRVLINATRRRGRARAAG